MSVKAHEPPVASTNSGYSFTVLGPNCLIVLAPITIPVPLLSGVRGILSVRKVKSSSLPSPLSSCSDPDWARSIVGATKLLRSADSLSAGFSVALGSRGQAVRAPVNESPRESAPRHAQSARDNGRREERLPSVFAGRREAG